MIKINNNWLISEWVLSGTVPGEFLSPSELDTKKLNWLSTKVPSTVAQAYRDADLWSFSNQFDFDSKDWWYKTTFKLPASSSSLLNFKGLATLCDVWLNGQHILSSKNMFIAHQLDVALFLQEENELILCFRSITNYLEQRRPRPQWKTKLVAQQQLRWVRTTLLGRIPGWTPPVAPNGPWQPLFFHDKNTPTNINIKPSLHGESGEVELTCQVVSADKPAATLTIGNSSTVLNVSKSANGYTVSGLLKIKDVTLWWPHTHGQPKLYTPELSISINNKTTNYKLQTIGFKNIKVDQANSNFRIIINEQAIFCRGACWTINDIVSLHGENQNLEQTLTLMRDAGANMIRIGGTMIYEQDLFYQLCSKLGIMVWQDFMFANMDYPIDDPDFFSSVNIEIQQTLTRLRQHICVSVYCGNSEIEQQAAMLGLAKTQSQNSLFTEQIPKLCSTLHPSIPYVSSTPTGNIQPFHTNKNITHYYGVGAYQRPVSELRQHDVRFTSECLGFANIPVTKTRNQVLGGQLPVTHHPKWKERTPRDTGTGWDFEDVRDHYSKKIFNIDTTRTRSFDTQSYMELSEVATGEIMSQVFSEWRSMHSQCSGGLVWFLKDFWQGAGWGIIDSNGYPKACYYYLKRCWQPINVVLTNESLNGIDIHVGNESTQNFTGIIEILLLNKDSVVIAQESIDVFAPATSTKTFNSDDILSSFYDTTYSYRFGPTKHSIVAVQLKSKNGEVISDAYHFPNAEIPYTDPNTCLSASAKQVADDHYQIELISNRFLYAVNIEVNGYLAENNFFHMLPNTTKLITMKRVNLDSKRYKGYVTALNITEDVKIKVLTD
ncbi:Beta-mannosidase [hydrothermal vent metagenome]|uniref:Beta-mannosidase B n=1 Tax=hydrothermal vent metagenome TaxID=652676 RepID=A0A3B0ZU78_9ZZZZ